MRIKLVCQEVRNSTNTIATTYKTNTGVNASSLNTLRIGSKYLVELLLYIGVDIDVIYTVRHFPL